IPYVDGVAVNATPVTTSVNTTTNNFGNDTLFLMSRNNASLFGNGNIDEVRLYKRALSASEIIALAAPAFSPCDMNKDGSTTVVDVQLATNQALGTVSCAIGDINKDGQCNIIDVQRVVNVVLGGGCVSP